jgi:hypothetical protein
MAALTSTSTVVEQLRAWASELDRTGGFASVPGVIAGMREVANDLELPVAILHRDSDLAGVSHELECPHCHAVGGLNSYFETIANRRRVNGFVENDGDKPLLSIDGFYETDGCDENGDDPRLCCSACDRECRIPAAVEIAWS